MGLFGTSSEKWGPKAQIVASWGLAARNLANKGPAGMARRDGARHGVPKPARPRKSEVSGFSETLLELEIREDSGVLHICETVRSRETICLGATLSKCVALGVPFAFRPSPAPSDAPPPHLCPRPPRPPPATPRSHRHRLVRGHLHLCGGVRRADEDRGLRGVCWRLRIAPEGCLSWGVAAQVPVWLGDAIIPRGGTCRGPTRWDRKTSGRSPKGGGGSASPGPPNPPRPLLIGCVHACPGSIEL